MAKKHHDNTALSFKQEIILALAANSAVYFGVAEQATKIVKLADQIIEAFDESEKPSPSPG